MSATEESELAQAQGAVDPRFVQLPGHHGAVARDQRFLQRSSRGGEQVVAETTASRAAVGSVGQQNLFKVRGGGQVEMLKAAQAELHENGVAGAVELHAHVLEVAHQLEAELFVQFDGREVERFFRGPVGNGGDDVVEIWIQVCAPALVDEGPHQRGAASLASVFWRQVDGVLPCDSPADPFAEQRQIRKARH